jgi:hypothetical protein
LLCYILRHLCRSGFGKRWLRCGDNSMYSDVTPTSPSAATLSRGMASISRAIRAEHLN